MSTEAHCTPVDSAYGSCERTCAVLRIYSGAIVPAEVTAMLGVPPTSTIGLGERKPPNSLGRSQVGRLNGWFLSSESAVVSKDLRHHLDWLLLKLEPSGGALRALQKESGVRMNVNCVWWSKDGGGGPTLWPSQMRRLAELNLECSFEFADYSENRPAGDPCAVHGR
jgi:uncharacterized protein DUF4279